MSSEGKIKFPLPRPNKNLTFSNPLFLLFLVQFAPITSGAVPISQFYLPPCCFMRGHPPGVVASSPSEQNNSYAFADTRSAISGEILELEADTNQVYKLIVPLKFPSSKAASASLVPPDAPPPSPSSFLPEQIIEESPPSPSSFLPDTFADESPPYSILKADIVDAISSSTAPPSSASLDSTSALLQKEPEPDAKKAGSDVFNVFLVQELEKMKKAQEEKEKLATPTTVAPIITEALKKNDVSVFSKLSQLGLSLSERLQHLSSRLQSIQTPISSTTPSLNLFDSFQNSHGPYQMYKTFTKRQVNHEEPQKMPAVWIKNLRKALFQSLTTKSDDKEHSPNLHDHANLGKPEMDEKLLWKYLRTAKLKFIDLSSQASSELPEEIYLPPGQGPIVSGIATLTGYGGNMEIRIPSELYIPNQQEPDNQGAGSGEGTTDLCKCSLVNTGDMILAYWSISRIVMEDGQPALQYLVYPHPNPHHTANLPTPPELIPFGNDPLDFRPSPIDPLLNEISNSKDHPPHHPSPYQQHHKLPIVTEGKHRKPKYHKEDFITAGLRPPAQFPTHDPDHPRGVLIDHDGKYTDDFLNLYRDAVNHHFNTVDSMKSMVGVDEQYLGHPFNHQPPPLPPTGPAPPPPPHHNLNLYNQQDIPFDFVEVPPTTIPGLATPLVGHTPPPYPDHPKSIQDIISPFISPPAFPPHQPHVGNVGHHLPQQPPFYNNGQLLLYDDQRFGLIGQQIPPVYSQQHHHQPHNQNGHRNQQHHQHPQNNKIPHNDYGSRPKLQSHHDKRLPATHHRDRDHPKKQAYVKEFYNSFHKPKYFAQRIGSGGGSLNDIDNPDGYILDFKK